MSGCAVLRCRLGLNRDVWDLDSTIPSSRSPPLTSPVTSPCATTPAPCRGLPVPSPPDSSPGRPLSTLQHNLPGFPCQAVGHITFQQYPAPVSHPNSQTRFLTAGPQYLLHSKSPASIFLGCFSPPVYATSTNKGQDPSSSPSGVQEVNGTGHKSLWLCQEAPRRALPKTSRSVPAATDQSRVSTDRNIKEISSQTYKPLPGVCKL